MIRSIWFWPIVIVVSACGALLTTFSGIGTSIRPIITLWFLLTGPGLAFVRLLHIEDKFAEWMLIFALSFVLDALVAIAMLYGGIWSPQLGLAFLVGISVVGAILQVVEEEKRQRVFLLRQGFRPKRR